MKFLGDKPLVMCSMFSAPAMLDRVGHGQGGKWEDALYRFVERKKRQNADGGRVPIKADFWHDRDDNPNNDHKFFNEDRATLGHMWDYNALSHGHRPEVLTYYQQFVILKLIRLARTMEFKLNLITDWTLKHGNFEGRPFDWDVIGQCVRAVSNYYRIIHNNIQDEKLVAPKLRELFAEVAGPIDEIVIEETHNEFEAHSWPSWVEAYRFKKDGSKRSDAQVKEKALWETNQQLERHHTRPREQWSDGLVCVSHGGRNDIEYNVGRNGADVVAIHPSRSGNWSSVDPLVHLERYGKHIYLNETKHYVDPSLWDKVIPDWFRLVSSTQDAPRLLAFEKRSLEKGWSFCRHSLTDMACGHWIDGDTLEEMPLDQYEKLHDNNSPPPPPPPDKEYDIHETSKDGRGHFNIKIEFPDQPATIDKDTSYTKKVRVELPHDTEIYQIDSFNGLDRGDRVEMDTFIYDGVGRALYQRSLHKEADAMFDSFDPRPCDAVTSRVDIHMHAHVTDPEQPPDKKARAHWNIMLWCK